MTDYEMDQIRLIAQTMNLDCFAVDYLRRKGDQKPFFTDINIYPSVHSRIIRNRFDGYYCKSHTFDTRMHLGIPEPNGKSFNEQFDEEMKRFVGL